MQASEEASLYKSKIYQGLLQTVNSEIEEDHQELKKTLFTLLPSKTKTAKNIIEHVFSSPGKLIRPSLYFMIAKMLKLESQYLYPIAAVGEYVHIASLLHDDVVDRSPLRRNKPTAHTIWGDQAAILVGDLIYARASEIMASTGEVELVEIFAKAICSMSEGELLQLEHTFCLDISTQIYLEIARHKTASLMGCICRAAGILAHLSQEKKKALESFGFNVGLAFQLVDDALDYRSKTQDIGKNALSDLKEGKVTLPLILLKQLVSAEEKQRMRKIFAYDEHEYLKSLDFLQKLVEKYHTVEKTIEKASDYTNQALETLKEHFPLSRERKTLEDLTSALILRMN